MADKADLTALLFDDGFEGALDPFDIFELWLSEAVEKEINDPTAMALASVDENGLPDIRMVLLNARDRRGFTFFTNFNSAKGRQLLANPKAALLFHWKSLRRQIRIRGLVEQVTDQEADTYFASRPRGAQLGAHASSQSAPLSSRQQLMDRTANFEQKFDGQSVSRPPHWSGLRIKPQEIEFWKDGAFRLHDRMLFTSTGNGWARQRLNP